MAEDAARSDPFPRHLPNGNSRSPSEDLRGPGSPDRTALLTRSYDGLPFWRWVARGFWIAVRLIAVFYLGQAGAKFFYQGF